MQLIFKVKIVKLMTFGAKVMGLLMVVQLGNTFFMEHLLDSVYL